MIKNNIVSPATFRWDDLGDAYEAFSSLCCTSDWDHIIESLAAALANLGRKYLSIVDFGAGIGTSSRALRQRLIQNYGVVADWSLIENDPMARSVLPMMMPSIGDTLQTTVYSEIPVGLKFDVLLLIHTSYYIGNWAQLLHRCYPDESKNDGIIVALTLPALSPFFSKGMAPISTGTAEEMKEILLSSGFNVQTKQLQSRFYWSTMLRGDKKLALQIARFVLGRRNVSENEVCQISLKLCGKNFDFKDILLVARRDT